MKKLLRRWYWSLPRNESKESIQWGRYLIRLLWRGALYFTGFTIGITLLLAVMPVPITPLMMIRGVEKAQLGEDPIPEYQWVDFNEIPNAMKLAVICAEDQNYFRHFGFDLSAIEKALEHNERSKRKRGASTISQQTAKNVFLYPARSWVRKGFETYFTVLIEALWSKKRVMTVYLNIAEFGDGIYGVQAAAQHFFKKDASALNRYECALLASVLPNPRKYSAAYPGPYLRRRQNWVIGQMRLWGNYIDFNNPVTPEKKK